jgi:hypothetical protein
MIRDISWTVSLVTQGLSKHLKVMKNAAWRWPRDMGRQRDCTGEQMYGQSTVSKGRLRAARGLDIAGLIGPL